MKDKSESLWSLIASAANEPEIEEIAHIVGNKRIKDNEVRLLKDCIFIDYRVSNYSILHICPHSYNPHI